MFGKSRKKGEVDVSTKQPEDDEVTTLKRDSGIIEEQVPDAECRRAGEGSFVIKCKTSDQSADILREVTMEQLLGEYPVLAQIKDVRAPLLFISEQAEIEIKEHISWNKRTKENVCEQGGILIGRPFLVNTHVVGIAECVIPAEVSQAGAAYLEMGTETWAKMLDIYDQRYKDKGLYVIGWFHTHPNGLPVFMSATDMGTQRSFFNQDWHFSVVLNPHSCLMACFNSANADICDYYPADFVDR